MTESQKSPQISIKELTDSILEEVGVDPSDLAHLTKFVDMRTTIWSLGEKVPNNEKDWVILGMFFSGESDVRVYVAPLREKNDAGVVLTFARITLSRVSPAFAFESIVKLDVFRSELLDEIEAVAKSMGLEDPEGSEEEDKPAAQNGAQAQAPQAHP